MTRIEELARKLNQEILALEVVQEYQKYEKLVLNDEKLKQLEKELKEVCLLEQTFVKDSDFTIKKLVAEVAKTVGSDIKVGRVVRFEVGEGIEKKEENFAEEVAKQLK